MNIAKNLRKLRTERSISQIDMAQKLSISRQAYNHYETGKRIPPIDMLNSIAQILNTNVQYLIQDENNPISTDDPTPPNKKEVDRDGPTDEEAEIIRRIMVKRGMIPADRAITQEEADKALKMFQIFLNEVYPDDE